MTNGITNTVENLIFDYRRLVVVFFVIVTVFMLSSMFQLRVDASFSKLLPLKHEYIKSFLKYRDEFGGANRIIIALTVEKGDIFTPQFFTALKEATDEIFFIPGVDRSRISSLFTPDVRFTEVVEDGISGGNVVPADFKPTMEGLEEVRNNILKSDIVGRLVANDFTAAIISASFLEFDPGTGKKVDYIKVSELLEERIRQRFSGSDGRMGLASGDTDIGVHIIGFAKIIGDLHQGAADVKFFFIIAFVLVTVLVYVYMKSIILTVIILMCSLMAVVWLMGLLPFFGYGIDPMSILVPFLVFAIGVSHAVQMVGAIMAEIYAGKTSIGASRAGFRRLLLPGSVALLSDTTGFLTISFIEIKIIQEMAVIASTGVAIIILTNLILIPVLLSYVTFSEEYRKRLIRRVQLLEPYWNRLAIVSHKKPAVIIIVAGFIFALLGYWKGSDIAIGDLRQGVPEFRENSVYNLDTRIIAERFSIGTDILSVIVETKKDGCVDFDVMQDIDRFAWMMENVKGVQSVISLPGIAKNLNIIWNEGSLKWHELPRNYHMLVQSTAYIPTRTGLLNKDCSAMPVLIFMKDHKAETISRVINEVKRYRDYYAGDKVNYLLAGHNVGVMAATNEVIEEAQFPILIYVFSAIFILCLIAFRSIKGALCVVIPLGVVSLMSYAVMTWLEIGLKVNTLPVVALGVGIGVDYGIYIFSCLQSLIKQGLNFQKAFSTTLEMMGSRVVFTAMTLAISMLTWMLSDLKFQADMGIMLLFMFLVNMLAAVTLLPALAAWLLPDYDESSGNPKDVNEAYISGKP